MRSKFATISAVTVKSYGGRSNRRGKKRDAGAFPKPQNIESTTLVDSLRLQLNTATNQLNEAKVRLSVLEKENRTLQRVILTSKTIR
jgi:hypothetical protein